MTVSVLNGDCRSVLRTLPDASVNCVVSSPPYFGLRDYGHDGQIGLEPTPDAFVAEMVAVFQECRRVLRNDGTLWLNLGDSYAGGGGHSPNAPSSQTSKSGKYGAALKEGGIKPAGAIKAKDLIGIPWRVAFALQADGWYLRQDIIWSKPNPMPESVTDRCTKAHEYIFLMSKSPRYYFDNVAIAEKAVASDIGAMDGGAQRLPDGSNANAGRNFRLAGNVNPAKGQAAYEAGDEKQRTKAGLLAYAVKTRDNPEEFSGTRNKRSVWTVPTAPFKEAHFATFPPALIEPCILAGCPIGGTVLDPFGGAGTTGLVADRLQRNAILIELNPEYAAMARKRISGDAPLLGACA